MLVVGFSANEEPAEKTLSNVAIAQLLQCVVRQRANDNLIAPGNNSINARRLKCASRRERLQFSICLRPAKPPDTHPITARGFKNISNQWIADLRHSLSLRHSSLGQSNGFRYATTHGEHAFFVRAVDRFGNSPAPSTAIKLFLWPC